MSTTISRLWGLFEYDRSINMTALYTSTATYNDRDFLIVLEFTYSLVENYIRNKNKASGDAYLGKGY